MGNIQALKPGQILVSKSGLKVAFVRLEATTMVVGESGKRLLQVPVNGGEERMVVRLLNPIRDNAGKLLPGQELNGRYSQHDIDAGVLTPTDEIAPARAQEVRVEKKEAVPSPEGGVDVPVVNAAEPKVPKAAKPDKVFAIRLFESEKAEIAAALGEQSQQDWARQTLLAEARRLVASGRPSQG